MSGKTQAELANMALSLAAEAGLRVWSITTDGTAVNLTMFRQLGCTFTTSYNTIITKFKHPTQKYYIYAILDPCHMLKLARNALHHLKSFVDGKKNSIKWEFFESLTTLQESEGFTLGNKLTPKHIQFLRHKMNVRLATQTLSSSVANAIEFLDV